MRSRSCPAPAAFDGPKAERRFAIWHAVRPVQRASGAREWSSVHFNCMRRRSTRFPPIWDMLFHPHLGCLPRFSLCGKGWHVRGSRAPGSGCALFSPGCGICFASPFSTRTRRLTPCTHGGDALSPRPLSLHTPMAGSARTRRLTPTPLPPHFKGTPRPPATVPRRARGRGWGRAARQGPPVAALGLYGAQGKTPRGSPRLAFTKPRMTRRTRLAFAAPRAQD